MQSVFIAGSRSLSKLNAQVRERLDNIMKQNLTVLIGDANGIDKAVQRYLAAHKYQPVHIYCMGVCRNNIGNWNTLMHRAARGIRHGRTYYEVKDLAMAKDASCGFMIWDGISKGTLKNVINLIGIHKIVLLYIDPKKDFYSVRTQDELDRALMESGIENVKKLLASLETKEEKLLIHF